MQEIFIKGLAESKTFQRFAVHTDRHINKIKKDGFEHVNSQIDELHKTATRAAYSTSSEFAAKSGSSGGVRGGGGTMKPPVKPPEGVFGFFNALGRVVRRDLGVDGNGRPVK